MKNIADIVFTLLVLKVDILRSVSDEQCWNIQLIRVTLDVLKLEPKHFNYKWEDASKVRCGLIAEDVEEIFPEVVETPDNYDEAAVAAGESYVGKAINYMELIPHIIKLCQLQQAEIDELKARLNGEI